MGPELTLGEMSQLNNIESVNSLSCPSGLSSEGTCVSFKNLSLRYLERPSHCSISKARWLLKTQRPCQGHRRISEPWLIVSAFLGRVQTPSPLETSTSFSSTEWKWWA